MSIKLFNRLKASLPDLKVLEILFEHCFEGMMLFLAAPPSLPRLPFFILSVAYFRSITLHLVFSRRRFRSTDCRGSIVSGPGTLTPGRHVPGQ